MRPGSCHVQKMALGILIRFKVRDVANFSEVVRLRQDIFVNRHHGDGAKFEIFCIVHRDDRDRRVNSIDHQTGAQIALFHARARPVRLRISQS